LRFSGGCGRCKRANDCFRFLSGLAFIFDAGHQGGSLCCAEGSGRRTACARAFLDGPGRREAAGRHGNWNDAVCHRKRTAARFIFQFGRIVGSSSSDILAGSKCNPLRTPCSMPVSWFVPAIHGLREHPADGENVRFRRGPVCHPEPPVRPRPPVEGGVVACASATSCAPK
jgi:hypothetical protein